MSDPVNQHVVPRWLLKRFAGPGGRLGAVYRDGSTSLVSPGRLGTRRHRYTLTDAPDPYAIERALSRVEGDGARALRHAERHGVGSREHETLAWMAALQLWRTDRSRRWAVQHAITVSEVTSQILPGLQDDSQQLLVISADPERLLAKVADAAAPPVGDREVTLPFGYAQDMFRQLRGGHLELATTPPDEPLVICDHPAWGLYPHDGVRPYPFFTNVVMPVGRHQVLSFTLFEGEELWEPGQLQAQDAARIRQNTILNSDLWVGCHPEDVSAVSCEVAQLEAHRDGR